MPKSLTKFGWDFECWAVQKHVNLVDLFKSFLTSIYLQNLASIPKHFLKLAAFASQPASPSAYFQRVFKFPWTPIFNFQFSNSQFPGNLKIGNFQIPVSLYYFLYPNPLLLIPLISYDPSRSEAIPPIPSDPSDPFDPFDPSRYLWSVWSPSHTHTYTHTHCQYLSFLSLRMLVIMRTSSTRGARLGTRAGTCTAENEP